MEPHVSSHVRWPCIWAPSSISHLKDAELTNAAPKKGKHSICY